MLEGFQSEGLSIGGIVSMSLVSYLMSLQTDYFAALEDLKRAHRKLLVSSILASLIIGGLVGFALANRTIDRVVILNCGQGIQA
jgi:hypothetical protein